MKFVTDIQTLEDLNLLGKYKNNSIFNVFNKTHTRGGERLLENMFQNPFTDAKQINERGEIFEYFQKINVEFPLSKELFDEVEHYLSGSSHPSRVVATMNNCRRKFLQYVAKEKEYELLHAGLIHTIEFLNILKDFAVKLNSQNPVKEIQPLLKEIEDILNDKQLKIVVESRGISTLSLMKLANFDFILKISMSRQMKRLIEIIHHIDVYISVAEVSRAKKFTKAIARPFVAGENSIVMEQVFHPALNGAVANDIDADHNCNVIFLTGANMAGKSTFMKSFSIAIYLAHMGFPVAAKKMEFSVQDGLYTSINVSDNLNMGYSHFYAEVLRVRIVADEVCAGKNLVVVFDELFKGTNVKDAYDATVAVSEAFSENQNCIYIISTHIIEAGHTLMEACKNFKFVYFPTVMDGKIPRYTYTLQKGITGDRHGMMIINNEKIIEIIKGTK